MPNFEERIAGGLIGLLVGDALGVPYEFKHPDAIPALDQIEFDPPAGFDRSHSHVEPGTWSDDGAQALCLLASLLHRNAFNAEDFSHRLMNWYGHGYMAVGGEVFDVGVQTIKAIERLQDGVPPLEAGGTEEHSQGNGSLMRVLPLALWHRGPDTALVEDAHKQSRVTHGHVVVQACCALYCLWARRTLQAATDPWADAVSSLRVLYRDHLEYSSALEHSIRPEAERIASGSGFVIDCLFSAKEAMAAGSYEQVVRTAIKMGQDTDTTACVAGGLAGIRDGVDGIPARWRSALRGRDEAEKLLQLLLKQGR